MPGLRLPFCLGSIESLAIPAVSFLILFLAYTSQYLFYYVEPGPLSGTQALWFNVFVLCIWFCYDRACTVDPGSKGWVEQVHGTSDHGTEGTELKKGMRWCKKCEAVKPPRAHHCRQCGRYTSLLPLILAQRLI
jgi:palmitoyltransferase